jgi:hypothetical protein
LIRERERVRKRKRAPIPLSVRLTHKKSNKDYENPICLTIAIFNLYFADYEKHISLEKPSLPFYLRPDSHDPSRKS